MGEVMTEEEKKEAAMLLLLYMQTIADACKAGNPIAQPYLDAEAIQVNSKGVVSYHRERFLRVMAEEMAKL